MSETIFDKYTNPRVIHESGDWVGLFDFGYMNARTRVNYNSLPLAEKLKLIEDWLKNLRKERSNEDYSLHRSYSGINHWRTYESSTVIQEWFLSRVFRNFKIEVLKLEREKLLAETQAEA